LCAGAVVEPTEKESGDFVLCYLRQYDCQVWIERRFL
jgi:hypothetical protein